MKIHQGEIFQHGHQSHLRRVACHAGTRDAVLHDVDAGCHHIEKARIITIFGNEVTHHLVPDAALFVAALFSLGLTASVTGQVGADQLGVEVNGDDHIGPHGAGCRHRHRVDQPPVQHPATLHLHRRKQARQCTGGASSIQHGAFGNPDFTATFHICGHGNQFLFQGFNIRIFMMFAEEIEQLLPLHHAPGQADIQQAEHILDRQRLHPVGKLVEGVCHVGPAHQGTDGGTRNHLRLHTDFFQPLNDANVRPAAGRATAKGQTDHGFVRGLITDIGHDGFFSLRTTQGAGSPFMR